MKPQKILLPIDVANYPPEVFELINRFGLSWQVMVILLHVVTLNIRTSENRVYQELDREAHAHLQQLAGKYLRLSIPTLTRVRLGKPAAEILAQARIDHPDLIVLPVHRPLLGKQPAFAWRHRSPTNFSSLAQRVIRNAPCDVLAVPMNADIHCLRDADIKNILTS